MRIVDINGTYEATNVHELENILSRRCEDGYNSFWLSELENEYPTLSLLVKGDIATLNYVPKELEAGFCSVGRMSDLEEGSTTTFAISKNHADDVTVSNDAILPFSAALQAAKEFFHSKRLPQCVEWLQL